tara:strand:+ start:1154 stop:2833 length:1680 start_codon:yes stop_codon:yes gene_type:complete
MSKFNHHYIVIILAVLFSACGGGGSDAANTTPQIQNKAPSANAGLNQTIDELNEVSLVGSGADSDGNINSYNWSQISGTTIELTNSNMATATFIAPDVTSDEVLTFQLVVTDNEGSTGNDTIDVTISRVNNSPLADAGIDQFVEERAFVELRGFGYDPEEQPISLTWSQIKGTQVSIDIDDSGVATFNAPVISEDEVLVFQLSVLDEKNESSIDIVEVTINKFYEKNILLRATRVTEDWHTYEQTGFISYISTTTSSNLKGYEAVIWDEVSAVHLYDFEGFDHAYWYSLPTEDSINYRESFRLLKFENLPLIENYDERSAFLKTAFIDIALYLTEVHQDADHHFMFLGHGGPGGKLLEAQMSYEDTSDFFQTWTSSLGHNLGLMDLGGPCNKGSMGDLQNFCKFVDYYIASDLLNGGYIPNELTVDQKLGINVELQFHNIFATSANLLEVVKSRIELKRQRYLYSDLDITANKVEQANYAYSCHSYNRFEKMFIESFADRNDFNLNDDLLFYLQKNNATESLLDYFDLLFLHSATTKDFFEWEIESNGMLMIRPENLNP